MSIIYSYPTVQPTVEDLLIGTDVGQDNATKSFTVQSLVSLINAAAGSGTVTSVQIATDYSLSATGGPITDAGVITMGLSTTGTPSTNTFLGYSAAGRLEWKTPTVSAGIGVFNYSNTVTTDVSSFNFTGAGVTLSSDAQGNVSMSIPGAVNAVESIIASTGIGLSSETGNVIVTNTGITSLVEGNGITIVTDTNGQATLTVDDQSSGTVTGVGAGDGLLITNSDAASPIIALDYIGADTYITQPAAAVPLAADLIPFHSVANNTVNKVAFGDIQASTLALVNTSITAANADAITNTYDRSQQGAPPNDRTIGAPAATQIVTCSASEYTDMANANELVDSFIYLTTAAAVPPNTVNFTVNDGITNTGACSYTITTTLNGSPFGGSNSSVTGAPGTQYTLQSTVSGFGTCSFSAGTVQTITNTIPTTPSPASVTQTVSGTLTAPPPPGNVTDTLQSISTSNISGPASGYTLSSNSPLSGVQGNPFQTNTFGLTATASTGYEFSTGATSLNGTYNQTASTYGSNTTTGSFPVGSAISLITYDVSYIVNTSGITNNTGNSFNYVITGGTFSGAAASGGPTSVPSGSPVTVTARIVPTGTDVISPNPTTATVTVASVTSDQTITVSPTGVINASTSTMTLNPTTSFTPAAAWSSPPGQWGYSINGGTRIVGLTASGQDGLSVVWTFSPNPPTPVTGYTSTGTTIGTVTGVLGTDSAVSASATGTATVARSSVGIAGQGGSPGTGPDPNPSCSYGVTSTAYTDSDISNGVASGMYLYDAASGTNPYGGNSQSYRCSSVNIGGTASVGYVTFGAGGIIMQVGSC